MRGKGEGTFTKSKTSGLWESRIELPSHNGKRRRLVKRSKDKRELLKYHNEKLRELREHGDLPSATPTVEAYLNGWLAEKAKHVAPNSMTNYRSQCAKHIIPAIGKRKLGALTAKDVKDVHAAVIKSGGNSTYALNAHRVLSSALSDAVEAGTITSNVAKRVKAPKRAKTKLQALTLTESIRLLEHIGRHEREGARWAIALLTGARRGEVIGLEVDRVGETLDLSWQLQRIKFAHGCKGACGMKIAGACPDRVMTDVPEDYEYRHVRGGLYLTRPKSEDSWRIIPLVEPLRSILARYMASNPSGGLVFTRPDGNPHDPKDDTAEWRRVLKRAGIDKDVRLHDLRHTAVLLLRAAGVEWDVIKLILGHATIAQSMAYLPAAEADDPRKHEAMEAVAALFMPKQIAA
jgi:integrase